MRNSCGCGVPGPQPPRPWAPAGSLAKGSVRGVVDAFEREAIRPHIGGSSETLLQAAVSHAGMLRYLDNDNSAGADSLFVRRAAGRPRAEGEPGPRITGLNENLAREVQELHTLGVAASIDGASNHASRFDPACHEPGSKTVLGRSYPAGPPR